MLSPIRLFVPLAILFAANAHAATYLNSFDGTDAVDSFPFETGPASWVVGGGVYTNNFTGTDTVTSASVPVAGVAGTNFVVSTQFTVSAVTAPGNSVSTMGFGALGGDASFTGGTGTAFYLADFSYANQSGNVGANRLRILAQGDSSGFTATNATADANAADATLAVVVGQTYTLRLTGTYSGTTLTLALQLFDAAGTTQIGATATATDTSPLTGNNFGYRNRTASAATGGETPSHTIAYDNFSVTNVPEAGSTMLALFGAMSALGFRRR